MDFFGVGTQIQKKVKLDLKGVKIGIIYPYLDYKRSLSISKGYVCTTLVQQGSGKVHPRRGPKATKDDRIGNITHK